jgi:hypothetical protein
MTRIVAQLGAAAVAGPLMRMAAKLRMTRDPGMKQTMQVQFAKMQLANRQFSNRQLATHNAIQYMSLASDGC